MSKKKAYVEKFQARLNRWDSEIESLKAKAAEVGADTKIEYERQIDLILENQKQAQAKLDEFRRAGDDAWDDMSSGVEDAWEKFESSTKNAISRFAA